jgi:hypothetical protein
MNLEWWIKKQIKFSEATFGGGKRTVGICKHIRKELDEIEKNPTDLLEWIDIAILAFDGAWRAGYTPEQIVAALHEKQRQNIARKWQANNGEDELIEHVRE